VLDELDREARLLTPVPIGDLAGPSPLDAHPDSAPPPSGEVEARPDPQRTPPPPVMAMPRRGVMKKRSARVEPIEPVPVEALEPRRAEAPTPPTMPPPPLAAVAGPSALQKAAALMPAVLPLDALPALAEDEDPEPPTTPRPPLVAVAAPAPAEEAPPPEPRPSRAAAARKVVDAAEWRTHAVELDKARGPKPVAVIERLFGLRYGPLVGAVARGEADAAVRGVVDAWRTAFEHSYREAFAALRVTGKRPPMVFDAPEIAARIARLNGARAVKLLLVDAMRFDVGERVADRLKEALTGRAVCVDRLLLWSALPTTTPTQMALLGRGLEGLRDGEPQGEPEPEITRGRAVSTLRRERVGAREVTKLDLVEARLRTAGPGYDERLDAIADEVTPILVRYIETLPPRTLLFLFGDHGFRLPASMDGRTTGPATQGGVSPEEVLVPGQAWLVGGVH
jgi:hypothetical protein